MNSGCSTKLKETLYNEDTANRIANLQVIYQVEKAKRDTVIQYLKTIELERELEERKKTELALEKLATLDPLTEVLNRREFFVLAEREVQNALQRRKPLSTILIDLDHFKDINDNHGHAVGDQALTAVAQIIKNNLRKEEILGRIGGDEFSILTPGSGWLQAQKIARRLQEKIAAYSFNAISLTVSLGIAELDRQRDEESGYASRSCRSSDVPGKTGRRQSHHDISKRLKFAPSQAAANGLSFIQHVHKESFERLKSIKKPIIHHFRRT